MIRLLCYCIAGLCCFSAWAAAEPYCPYSELHIATTVTKSTPGVPENHMIWRVVPTHTKTGCSLRFLLEDDSANNADDFAVLTLQPDKNRAQARMLNGDTVHDTDGLLLYPGSPAPLDVVPSFAGSQARAVTKRTAGGYTFSREYLLSRDIVSTDDDYVKERLDPESISEKELIKITVTDTVSNTVVLVRLWPKNKDWWIFEETPFRRSRLLTP